MTNTAPKRLRPLVAGQSFSLGDSGFGRAGHDGIYSDKLLLFALIFRSLPILVQCVLEAVEAGGRCHVHSILEAFAEGFCVNVGRRLTLVLSVVPPLGAQTETMVHSGGVGLAFVYMPLSMLWDLTS